MGTASCAAPVDFNAAAQADASGNLVVEGSTPEVGEHTASCGGSAGGPEVVYRFTAPSAGQWVFSTVAPGLEGVFDTVLHARSACDDAGSELACSDDSQGTTQSTISLELAQDEAIFLFADAYGMNPGGNLRLTAFQAVAPAIVSVESFYNPESRGLAVRVAGTDANGDVVQIGVDVLDAEGNSLLEDGALDFDFFELEHADGDFTGSFIGVLPEELGEPAAVRVTVLDAAGLRSEPADDDVAATPPLAVGDACDPVEGFGDCPDGSACVAADEGMGAGACTEVSPPAIESAEAFYNEATFALAVRVAGTDGDNDAIGFGLEPLDEEGNSLLEGGALDFDFDEVTQADGNFEASLIVLGDEELPTPAAVRVTVYDSVGLRSDPVLLELGPPPALDLGDGCDEVEGFGICPAGALCLDDDPEDEAGPVCAEAVAECPADWTVTNLNDHAVDAGWSVAGDLSLAEEHGAFGTCGFFGLGTGANDVYAFTAPAAGLYGFENASEDARDLTMWARSLCGVDVPAAEVACNDDNPNEDTFFSYFEIALEANETVYVFVDTYGEEDRGPYTLNVQLLE